MSKYLAKPKQIKECNQIIEMVVNRMGIIIRKLYYVLMVSKFVCVNVTEYDTNIINT